MPIEAMHENVFMITLKRGFMSIGAAWVKYQFLGSCVEYLVSRQMMPALIKSDQCVPKSSRG